MPTRREFLAGSAATGVGWIWPFGSDDDDLPPAGPDYPDDDDWHLETTDEDGFEASDDLDELETYKPRFNTTRTMRQEIIGLYGWKAESEDHDTDAYYYWRRDTHQDPGAEEYGILDRAAGALASDAHLWDHEPVIIFVDSETGETTGATVTGGHHYPLDVGGPDESEAWTQDEHPEYATHLHLEVVEPWGHYREDEETGGAKLSSGAEFGSFLDERPAWIRNGFYANSWNYAVDDPWFMGSDVEPVADSWWAPGTTDARAARIWNRLGLRGADETDPLRD